MSLLLHVCCGPCLLYPLQKLDEENRDFTCYFFNPNIHPYREFKKRLQTFKALAQARKIKIIVDKDYGLREFLRAVVFNEKTRCNFCYKSRLEKTANLAVQSGLSAFSTTLLYSKFQNHALIKKQGVAIGLDYNIPFAYDDYRSGWQEGVNESLSLGLYRQNYCGCIYSEQERFDSEFKKRAKERKNNV